MEPVPFKFDVDVKEPQALFIILDREEKFEPAPYPDDKGNWTVGWGHLIGKKMEDLRLTRREALKLLEADAEEALEGARNIFGPIFDTFEPARQNALVSMTFQMGEDGVRDFTHMVKAVKEGEWERAAVLALKSKWAKQDTPARALRMASMLSTGEMDPYYG